MNGADSAARWVQEAYRAFTVALREMEIDVADEARQKVLGWLEFYSSWSGRRVAGFEQPDDLGVKLLADSFSFIKAGLVPHGPAADLGSGNGWPGLAVGVSYPGSQVTLIDSRIGACEFLTAYLKCAGLPNIRVWHGRAEDSVKEGKLARSFGFVVSRAMAPPPVTVEIGAGMLEPGGRLVVWLGPSYEARVAGKPHLSRVGLVLERLYRYELPRGMGKRLLACYAKQGESELAIPRSISQMVKVPLF